MHIRAVYFGAGKAGRDTLEWAGPNVEVVAFVDNDPAKHGTYVDGIKVISPEQLKFINTDVVVITSGAIAEIYVQLKAMGIQKERIRFSGRAMGISNGWKAHSELLREFYLELERPEVVKSTNISADLLGKYAASIDQHPEIDFTLALQKVSMLSVQVLMMLRFLAIAAQGRILEIGAYVGGSTVALARGIATAGKARLITVEPGGSYKDHPHIPSADIFSDLERNIESSGMLPHVMLIKGWSAEPHVLEKVRSEVGSEGIGLLFIDADGNVERDFGLYSSLLRDDCLVVLDDYSSTAALDKSGLIRPWVDLKVREGILEELGVFPWGTWFGRLRRRPGLDEESGVADIRTAMDPR